MLTGVEKIWTKNRLSYLGANLYYIKIVINKSVSRTVKELESVIMYVEINEIRRGREDREMCVQYIYNYIYCKDYNEAKPLFVGKLKKLWPTSMLLLQ